MNVGDTGFKGAVQEKGKLMILKHHSRAGTPTPCSTMVSPTSLKF